MEAPDRRKLSEIYVRRTKPRAKPFLTWDTRQRGLALLVQPSGQRSWKCIYRHHRPSRWLTLGDATAIGLKDARKLAQRAMMQVTEGNDPAAERAALRSAGTFAELATRYIDVHAKKRNRSWRQADALVRRHLLPRWAKLRAAAIRAAT
jgi:hypothetical protein